MDGRHFDHLARALSEAGTRRGLLGLLATLPVLAGLLALLDADETDAKGRRKRRKKRHKHGQGNGKGRRKNKNKHKKHKHKKRKCKAHSQAETCASTCGKVKNNCQQTVDCGPCACDPPCGACATCTAALACEPCDPCCNDVCCAQAKAVCHAGSGACCVPNAHAQTCDNQCGEVVDNCGLPVDCGPCTCGVGCAFCQICDEATGDCVPDPLDAGEPCGQATCADGVATAAPTCDAGGTCQPGAQEVCAPYVCDGDACATTCGNTGDCRAGFFCDATDHCVAQGDQGDSCEEAAQCQSGFCVDEVCCDTACDGACAACNLSGNVGTCTTEADGAGCGGGNVCCAGSCQECCDRGDCFGTEPVCVHGRCEPCSADPEGCPNDTCCDAGSGECVGTCPASEPVCGTDHVCVPCERHAECGAGFLCLAGACQACTVTCAAGDHTCVNTDLQTALNEGGTVYVCPGRYTGNLTLTTVVTVIGSGQGNDEAADTIFDAQGSGRVLHVASATGAVDLQRLRFTGGELTGSNDHGAGILHEGSTLQMRHCTVAGNSISRGFGGGISLFNSRTLEMTDCTLQDNQVLAGGGGAIVNGGTVTMTDCRLRNNRSRDLGGAMYTNGTVILAGETEVRGNVAFRGGGLWVNSGRVTIGADCRVTENTATEGAGSGGGILLAVGTVTLEGDDPSPIVVNNCHENCVGGVAKCAAGGTCP